MLPAVAFRRLWENEWTSGSGDAVREDDLLAALTLPGPLATPEPGWVYCVGVDIGVSRDATAVVCVGKHVGRVERRRREAEKPRESNAFTALRELGMLPALPQGDVEEVLHRATGRLKLASVKVWKPSPGQRVDLAELERYLLELHTRFRVRVAVDPWQGELLIQRLQRAGVFVGGAPFVPGNLQSMATMVLESFGGRVIDLYPDSDLVRDLKSLRVAERQYGFRLESPRGPSGHGDAATALQLALYAARSVTWTAEASRIEGSLAWPAVNLWPDEAEDARPPLLRAGAS